MYWKSKYPNSKESLLMVQDLINSQISKVKKYWYIIIITLITKIKK